MYLWIFMNILFVLIWYVRSIKLKGTSFMGSMGILSWEIFTSKTCLIINGC